HGRRIAGRAILELVLRRPGLAVVLGDRDPEVVLIQSTPCHAHRAVGRQCRAAARRAIAELDLRRPLREVAHLLALLCSCLRCDSRDNARRSWRRTRAITCDTARPPQMTVSAGAVFSRRRCIRGRSATYRYP